MTVDRAKELLPIIKAYSEGKEIEIYIMGEWRKLIHEPLFDSDSTYRIKPTEYNECNLVDPFGDKYYRAFESCEELRESCHHKPIWVKYKKDDDFLAMITAYSKSDDGEPVVWITDSWVTLKRLFAEFRFANDMPCGVEE